MHITDEQDKDNARDMARHIRDLYPLHVQTPTAKEFYNAAIIYVSATIKPSDHGKHVADAFLTGLNRTPLIMQTPGHLILGKPF